MATVRYVVDDVAVAVDFYRGQLGFEVVMHPMPEFAMLVRDDLRLLLVSPIPVGHPGGGSRPMPDGTAQEPGGWNRFVLQVDDLEAAVSRLRSAGVAFRGVIVSGVGGKQILAQDPSGNVIELFQPTMAEADEHAQDGHTHG